MYLKEDITHQFSADLGLKLRFGAIDLAPNEQLETGFSAIDRDRVLMRMDKIYTDKEIEILVNSLGPTNSSIICIDMPKSLSIPGRWRQEEIKMHPLRLKREDGSFTSRFENRGLKLYEQLDKMGVLVFLYFNYWTRVNYDMQLPFRSRSPQGCRALQSAIEQQLGVKSMPTNLAPSSVLDSMVGSYAAWSVWAGQPGVDYEVHLDEKGHRILKPLRRTHETLPPPKRHPRRGRRYIRPAQAAAAAKKEKESESSES